MAEPTARPTAAEWDPREYAFDPYGLTAERLSPEGSKPSTSSAAGSDDHTSKEGAGPPDQPVKRRPGRQKRTSVLCQVLHCGEELINAKKYYRRYRICQLHCNMPSMMVDGQRQRFCQQCGRFHAISEFEGAKRSCRRKLKRHNERRRTLVGTGTSPQPAALASDSKGGGGPGSGSEGGAQQRSGQPAQLPPSEGHPSADSQPSGAGLPTRQASSAAAQSPSPATAPLLAHPARALTPEQRFPAAGAPLGPLPSKSASLDSSPRRVPDGGSPAAHPALPHTCCLETAGELAGGQPGLLAQQQPQPPQPQQHGAAAAARFDATDAELEAVLQQLLHDEDLRGLPLQPAELFLPQRSIKGVPPQPLQLPSTGGFAPRAAPARAHPAAAALAGRRAWDEQQYVPSLDVLPMDLLDDIPLVPLPEEMGGGRAPGPPSAAPPPALPLARSGSLSGYSSATAAHTSAGGSTGSLGAVAAAVPLAPPRAGYARPRLAPPSLAPMHGVSAAVLAAARGLATPPGSGMPPLVGYAAAQPDRLTTMSLKVFNCTPDQLLPSVRAELGALLGAGELLLEGCIRPGCTHLTLGAVMAAPAADELEAAGLCAAVPRLLRSGGGGGTSSGGGGGGCLEQDMLVQLGDELAVVKRRRLVALLSLQASSPCLAPALAPPLPLAVAGGAAPLLLRGRHLAGEGDLLLARQQGRNLAVELHAWGKAQGGQWLKARLLGLRPGWVELEAQHGGITSRPRPLLVLPSAEAAAEVRALERDAARVGCVDTLLRDVGLVVQFLCRGELAAEGLPCPAYTPALLAAIAGKARRLAAATVARGWAATAEMLLRAVTADGAPAAQALAAMDACCPAGATLLHVAAGTGSVPLLRRLAAWGADSGVAWAVDAPAGQARVTPLHVAAVLPNHAAVLAALTGMAPAAAKLWALVQAADGTTPEGLAEAVAAVARGRGGGAGMLQEAPCTPSTCGSRGSSRASCASSSSSPGLAEAGAAATSAKLGPKGGGEDAAGCPPPAAADVDPAPLHASKPGKPGDDQAGTPAGYGGQLRRGRRALKAQLDDLHIASILSEVESGLEGSSPAGPRPLAGAMGGTAAAAAALLRSLRQR